MVCNEFHAVHWVQPPPVSIILKKHVPSILICPWIFKPFPRLPRWIYSRWAISLTAVILRVQSWGNRNLSGNFMHSPFHIRGSLTKQLVLRALLNTASIRKEKAYSHLLWGVIFLVIEPGVTIIAEKKSWMRCLLPPWRLATGCVRRPISHGGSNMSLGDITSPLSCLACSERVEGRWEGKEEEQNRSEEMWGKPSGKACHMGGYCKHKSRWQITSP